MRILIFSWLFLIPLFQILPGRAIVSVSAQCLEDQKLLLLQLKEELKLHDPASSTKLVRWNNSQDCCSWDGVGCDGSGHVISLTLDNETISGGIENSSSLFSLEYLQRLNFANNNFSFTQIPSGFINLTNLMYLNLSNAGFVGQIPSDLGRMRRLVTLDLSTRFPGIEPLEIDNSNLRMLAQNLTELQDLYLDGVNISAGGSEWCKSLSSLSNLRVLSLSSCHLSGPLDSSLSELHLLSFIRLDINNLSTTVPDFFGNFSNLTFLSLVSCKLYGRFPEKIFQVLTLQYLDLSFNNLMAGSLPQFPQGGSFRTIVLRQTNFSGSLPDSIDNLQALSNIDLSNCNFSGPIPSTMANLKDLTYLDFSSNKFDGPVPPFQMSKKLKTIDLSRNNLTGNISSSHFEGLTEIVEINLGYNSLNGSIPSSLFALPLLQRLLLSNNQFDGQVNEFPNASAPSLDTLDLSSNQLIGPIPVSFFQLESLKVLALSSNNFNGTMQLERVQRLSNLTRLELSYNNLSIIARSSNSTLSSFPQFTELKLASCNLQEFPDLKNQAGMSRLDLSDNEIKGEIPNWIWTVGNENLVHLNLSCNHLVDLQENYAIPNLLVLDLHSNQLQGEFPVPPESAIYVDYSGNHFNNSISPDIGKFIPYASFFSLSNNRIVGGIPESICNANYLQVLDLSNNFLTGSIPECIFENMGALGVLNLGRNNLSGTVPDKFSGNCGLKTIDLSRNLLKGKTPRSLVNCTLLEVLNIGNNKIEDAFPCTLKNLSSLRVLVLRSNLFGGSIHCPGAKNSWSNLQIIDIASNNFSGDLSPMCFSNWKGMMTADKNGQSQQNHIIYEYLTLEHRYYQDTVTVTIKGLELELQKILTVFTSIDLSDNRFQGGIPDTVGDLKALYVLNLSHNVLSGVIPESIGNLTRLGSLDLSSNQLSGMIPSKLANLTFLSVLNLSFNHLVGRIPLGNQFNTFAETSFENNTALCGFPLNTSCNEQVPNSLPRSNDAHSSLQADFNWQFIFTGLGFGVGAAIVLAPLIICKEERDWFDERLEKLFRMIFPRYGFSYTRYDEGKVLAVENFEDDNTEDSEDEELELEDELFRDRYCVFCTKLDVHRKKAVHNPKCTCHTSPNFSIFQHLLLLY